MTVSNNWRAAYDELRDFIVANPEIEITKNKISIPAVTREKFYRLFDTVRAAFVDDTYPVIPQEALTLSESYQRAEKELVELIKLDGITIPIDIHTFVSSPKQGLVRVIFNDLFDLIQDKIDIGTFEQVTLRKLEATLQDLCRWGYECWVTLSLAKLFEPDGVFQVVIQESGGTVSKIDLQEIRTISIGQQPDHFRVRLPDFVLHSSKTGKYIAIKSELSRAIIATYGKQNQSRLLRNYSDFSGATLGPRTMSIFLVETKEEIPIVADTDSGEINQPDIAVECMEPDTMKELVSLNKLKQRNELLKPKLGTYVVSRQPVVEPNLLTTMDNVHILNAGLDPMNLEPIIESITKND
jgi:hypothetical protein